MSVPNHYLLRVHPLDGSDPVEIDVDEVIAASGLDFRRGCIVKYAIRAGRKPDEPMAKDAAKCADYARRWLRDVTERGR